MKTSSDVLISIYRRVYDQLILEMVDLLADGTPENDADFLLILSIVARRKQENILDALNKKEENKE